MDAQKYLVALDYESPDAVLGDLMSDTGFKLKLPGIRDACDWYYASHNSMDRAMISKKQPLFYNVGCHRPVDREDVVRIVESLTSQN